MAVTITGPQLAGALRLGDGDTLPDDPIGAEVTRLLAAATAAVEAYAENAPDAVQNEAVVLVCGHWFDSPRGTRAGIGNAMMRSGAEALLAPYRPIRAGAVGDV